MEESSKTEKVFELGQNENEPSLQVENLPWHILPAGFLQNMQSSSAFSRMPELKALPFKGSTLHEHVLRNTETRQDGAVNRGIEKKLNKMKQWALTLLSLISEEEAIQVATFDPVAQFHNERKMEMMI